MFYFETKNFYLDLKKFLSPEFKRIRHLYLYCYLLSDSAWIKNSLEQYFCCEFLMFIDRVKKQTSSTKLMLNLHKIYKKLSTKYDNQLKIVSKKQLSDDEKRLIESRVSKFFRQDLNVQYCVDKSIIGGLIIVIDHVIYNLSIKSMLVSVKENIMKNLVREMYK